jgi:hypothetical protein
LDSTGLSHQAGNSRHPFAEGNFAEASTTRDARGGTAHCPNGPRAVIGLDANVIVRYLAQDDARQAAAATRSF